jgi:hypothetical protein
MASNPHIQAAAEALEQFHSDDTGDVYWRNDDQTTPAFWVIAPVAVRAWLASVGMTSEALLHSSAHLDHEGLIARQTWDGWAEAVLAVELA